MTRIATTLVSLALAAWGGSASAADFSDPTWPCIQRKVQHLSLGVMWPHAVPDAVAPSLKEPVERLAERLAQRRVTLEEAGAMVDAFAAEAGASEEVLSAAFAAVFETIDRNRSRIIEGIGRYSLDQAALAGRIDAARDEFGTLEAKADKTDADFDRMDALEEQIDWDERIYTDRAKSLTYVCESPVLLEQRVYALAQLMLERVAE